jgi:hypothetical protein
MAGTLREGLYALLFVLLMKKDYVLCEVWSDVEDTDQDLKQPSQPLFLALYA